MKKIYVTRPMMPEFNEYCEEIRSLWDTHIITNMGEKHKKLEETINDYLGSQYTSLFTNGHMALEMALQALNLKGEVITTPFTFISTTHAIVRNGLTPVFCDIKSDDFTIDADKIESLITEKTSAILPVHVYGNICDVEKIEVIANKYNLKVIYDAAHAFGIKYKGRSIAQCGDLSMFSFHATKVFNTIEGGAVCFKDKKIGDKLYHLKNFGITDETTIDDVGANAKMNEFQAAMGLCNLKHLKNSIINRSKIHKYYVDRLSKFDGIQTPSIPNFVESNFSYFPIVINEKILGISRNELYDYLLKKGIYTRKYFYPLTSECSCYKGLYRGDTDTALYISERILTLPLYGELDILDAKRICDEINNAINCFI